MHDCKGLLEVEWKAAPAGAEKDFFEHPWKSSVVDGGSSIEHR
ncbi:MAG: hypothetical protein WCP53_02835 [Verrucomicrobiota bacterium]